MTKNALQMTQFADKVRIRVISHLINDISRVLQKLLTIMFIKFWDFLMVEQTFLLPQVKQSVIFSNKLVYTSCLTSCQIT